MGGDFLCGLGVVMALGLVAFGFWLCGCLGWGSRFPVRSVWGTGGLVSFWY